MSAEVTPINVEGSDVPSFYRVLGIRVHTVQIPAVIAQIEKWIEQRSGTHWIAVEGMQGVTEAQQDTGFKRVLNSADLVVPDGMPLVWLARLQGHPLKRRVYGPELMLAFCEQTCRKGYRHFLYGGAPGVAEALASSLEKRFCGLVVAGTFCPPFGDPPPEVDREAVERIQSSRADVLWVGLSTPKQERWMADHRNRLDVPVMLGVGAAFDLNTGRVRQAPMWMRESGLEWFFRLSQEPGRLWRRYLLQGSRFVYYVVLELTGLRRFD